MNIVQIRWRAVLVLAAIGDGAIMTGSGSATAAGATPAPAMMVDVPTNAWLGRWTSRNGRALDIAAKEDAYSGRYVLTFGPGSTKPVVVEGLAYLDTIVFVRDGKQSALRAGSAMEVSDANVAWAKRCLVVAADEVYCRV